LRSSAASINPCGHAQALVTLLAIVLRALRMASRSRFDLVLENVALRQQVDALERKREAASPAARRRQPCLLGADENNAEQLGRTPSHCEAGDRCEVASRAFSALLEGDLTTQVWIRATDSGQGEPRVDLYNGPGEQLGSSANSRRKRSWGSPSPWKREFCTSLAVSSDSAKIRRLRDANRWRTGCSRAAAKRSVRRRADMRVALRESRWTRNEAKPR